MTNKGYWGNIKSQKYLNNEDKTDIINQLTLVRDSPSEIKYKESEEKLMEMTEGLFVRPGQSNSAVSFHDYYFKNWKCDNFRWVYVYRKNLPIGNTNDTQASESTFSSIKRMIKAKFNGGTPKLEDLLRVLPQFIDDRTASRQLKEKHGKRFIIQDEDPQVQDAYTSASWQLKSSGMDLFKECMDWAKARFEFMDIDGTQIVERFTGKNSKDYTGNYTCDGLRCNCSHFCRVKFCRHLIAFRMKNGLSLFEVAMFPIKYRKGSVVFNEEIGSVPTKEDNIDVDTPDIPPSSPGMESLIEQRKVDSKRLKKKEKHHEAWEAIKIVAECCARLSTPLFNENLEVLQVFAGLMREGLPDEVKNVILKYKQGPPESGKR